jgi:CRP-like cAMP-binding protein
MINAWNQNDLLGDLAPADLSFVRSVGSEVRLSVGFTLLEAGTVASYIYFPYAGSISFLVLSKSGAIIEAGFVGNDGAVGTLFDPGTRLHFTRAVVVVPCLAFRLPVDRFETLEQQSASFRRLVNRNNIRISERAQQLAACNLMHRLESRLCRWLLQTIRGKNDQRIELTQDFLSQILGVTRARLNEALKALEVCGALAQSSRGVIQVLNGDLIRKLACECAATLQLVPD